MWCSGKDSVSSAEDVRDMSSIHWSGKIPWRRKWQPTPVFVPEKSHGQRSLVSYSSWGRKESNTTEQLSMSTHITSITVLNELCATLKKE